MQKVTFQVFTDFRAVVSRPNLWVVKHHFAVVNFRYDAVEEVAEFFQTAVERDLVHSSGQLGAPSAR